MLDQLASENQVEMLVWIRETIALSVKEV